MGMQHQQAGNNGEYRVAEKVDGISHFFTIALDHGLQFDNILRRGFTLIKTVQAINNRQYTDHKIETEIYHRDILPQSRNKLYHHDGKSSSRSTMSTFRIIILTAKTQMPPDPLP